LKIYLNKLITEAAEKLPYLKDVNITFDIPKVEVHGDLSCNAAMLLTKKLKKNPRQIAEEIISNLNVDEKIIEKIEIAGSGFINFFFSARYVAQIVNRILEKGVKFGSSEKYSGKRANVEFVSANPTGPLTVGHGRGAVIGDTVANLLEWIGYEVEREYYFNDAGRQMRILGDSVRLRYLELLGEKIDFPEDYYQGEYIIEAAKKLIDEKNDTLKDEPAEGVFKDHVEAIIFNEIKETLKRLTIHFKTFFNEKSLYDDGKIDKLLSEFEKKNLSYEKEGAKWLKFSDLGIDQDKVIVKSTGEPTYRLPDIAYHITKFERGYDLIVDLFGADHKDSYPDVVAGLKALSYDTEKIKVLIHQFVTLVEGGDVVKMSTRKANIVALDELIDEVGIDIVRYFFNMRGISSHMNFDLALAKKQSDENPVFYLQYAHARICSILKNVKEENLEASVENLQLLTTVEEQQLIKRLHQFEDEVLYSALNYEPNRVCTYLETLASAFHKFYTFCRILGTEKDLAEARLALAVATKNVIKNGLTILGVDAPEKM